MIRISTTDDFIKKAAEVHGDKYDYSKSIYVKWDKPITIICPKHGEFHQIKSSHLRGSGCAKCASESTRFDIGVFLDRSMQKHGNKFDYSLVEYKNSKSKVKIICPIHGEFLQFAWSHMNGHGCKKCDDLNKTETKENFLKIAKTVHSNEYTYDLSNYKNRESKISIFCQKHGEFIQSAKNHINLKNKCPKCKIDSDRLSADKIIERFKKIHGNKYDYSEVSYVNIHKKVCIICDKHGRFWQTQSNHIYGKGCNECGRISTALKRSKNKSETFVNRANNIHDNKYDYSLTNYAKALKKVDIICKKHGLFKQTPNNHLRGSGCPMCKFEETDIEKFTKNFLNEYNLNFDTNNRVLISPYELDFYLPNYKLAIECNGIYWHSESKGKDKNYHLNKTTLSKEKEIRLIHILQNEIVFKSKAVKSNLKSILNLNKYKILAQKCKIREIDIELKNRFLEKYHLEGSDNSSVRLGLFYRNRLIAIMTFCENNANDGWDLTRYATVFNFSIINGEKELLKYFEKRFSPRKIIGYSDLRWSQGGFYRNLGFDKIKQLEPNYWYFKNNGQNMCRHLNFEQLEVYDPQKTEWENAQDNGWNRIWDCGSLIFKKNIDKTTKKY